MTAAAGTREGSRASARPPAAVLAHHALMLAVMVATMRPGAGAVDHLAGAGVLVAVSMVVAARRRGGGSGMLLDAWAMIALLVIPLLGGTAAGHHGAGAGIPALPLGVAVLLAWAALRARALRTRLARPRAAIADAAVSAASLLLMLALPT